MGKFTWTPSSLKRLVRKEAIKILEQTGVEAVQNIKAVMKPGRSIPGNPPGVVSGRLKRSIIHKVDKEKLILHLGVSDDQTEKALALELGAPSRNLQPRPFLRPELRRAQQRARHRIRATRKRLKR